VGGTGASDRIGVSNKTIPEVDISYFFTKNIAAELVLTYPQNTTSRWMAPRSAPSSTCRRRCWCSSTSCRAPPSVLTWARA
jgi:hypothetical protein